MYEEHKVSATTLSVWYYERSV